LQFNKTRHFKMLQDAVMVPMGDWAKARLKKLGKNDVIRFDSQVSSGFGKNVANWVGRHMAYPSNVLHFATECGNKKHSATFPKALPEWFIKLFTEQHDWVLDPFSGSGTSNIAAWELGRNSVGIDNLPEYVTLAQKYLAEAQSYANKPRGDHAIRGKTHPGLSHGQTGELEKAGPVEGVATQESLFTEGKRTRHAA
jgi:site-specific DNA-methyltransferase (adenine-specific)